MGLCFLKVITAIHWVKPRIEEEFCPFAILHNYATSSETVLILRGNEFDVACSDMRKGLDDAVWWHNRVILQHHLLELLGAHHMFFNFGARIHDERVLVEVPNVLAIGIFSDRVSHSYHFCPRKRGSS